MVIVVAIVRAIEGCADQLGAKLRGLIDKTRAEDGCLQYDLHVCTTEPGEFVFYERWASAEDLKAHFATPHFLEVHDGIADLLDGVPVIKNYALVE